MTVGDELEKCAKLYGDFADSQQWIIYLRNRLSSGKKRKMDSKTHLQPLVEKAIKYGFADMEEGASFG